MAAHARLSPSKAEQWVNCPGSIKFIEQNQDKLPKEVVAPGGAAAQGTLAHSYAEARINSQLHPDEDARDKYRRDANALQEQLPEELIENAEMYASWVVRFVELRPDIPWGLELKAPLWYEPASNGTADFWAVDKDTLVVVDYKSGRIKVDVEMNLQILIYLIAIYDRIKDFNPQIRNFRAGVHQPFTMSPGEREPRFWEFGIEELERLKRFLSSAAREVDAPISGNHRLVATPKGCRFCPAKAICPAQGAKLAAFADMADEDPEALDGPTLFRFYYERQRLRAAITAIEEYVKDLDDPVLERNGFEKLPGRRTRGWSDENEFRKKCKELGLTPTEESIRSVASIQKELGKTFDDLFDGLVEIKEGAARVVATEPREEARFKVEKN